jgi:hypothetical protein
MQKNSRKKTNIEKPQALQRATGWKLWLFRIIAVIVIPILLLIFTEIGLRSIDFGYCPHALIKCNLNGKKAYCDSPTFTRLFFTPTEQGDINFPFFKRLQGI